MREKKCVEFLTIACIRKVRGRRGEVAAEILTDFPERFRAGAELLLSGGSSPQTLYLENIWYQKGLAILKFRGFEDISAAETLVGRELWIPISDRSPLPPGMVYLSDLVGCAVIEQDEAERKTLGHVESVEETGASPLLQVLTAQGEVLIPFARDICTQVDVEKKEIRVRLPEGLKELNQKDEGIGIRVERNQVSQHSSMCGRKKRAQTGTHSTSKTDGNSRAPVWQRTGRGDEELSRNRRIP